jgi:hypothetical protein
MTCIFFPKRGHVEKSFKRVHTKTLKSRKMLFSKINSNKSRTMQNISLRFKFVYYRGTANEILFKTNLE